MRIDGEDLVTYFWNGATPIPREVRQIGLGGAVIVAPERFYPGTLIQLVLEDRASRQGDGASKPHICVYAMALRAVEDGFSVAFPSRDPAERRRLRRFLEAVVRKAPLRSMSLERQLAAVAPPGGEETASAAEEPESPSGASGPDKAGGLPNAETARS
jgi:hypothetical protein